MQAPHPDEGDLTANEVADLFYEDAKKTRVPVEQVEKLILLLHGNKDLQEAYNEMKEMGLTFTMAEEIADSSMMSLDEVLEMMEREYTDNDSDEFLVSRIIEYILLECTEGVKYIAGINNKDLEEINLEDWIHQFDDAIFEDIKQKNPVWYEKAKRKAMQIIVIAATTRALQMPDKTAETFATTNHIHTETDEIIEKLTDKALADSRFDLFGILAKKTGISLNAENQEKLMKEWRERVQKQVQQLLKEKEDRKD